MMLRIISRPRSQALGDNPELSGVLPIASRMLQEVTK